ncbi:hypothetical protein, partial [Photobacterium damselae]
MRYILFYLSLSLFSSLAFSNSLVPTSAEYMNNHSFIQSGKYPVPSSGNFTGYFFANGSKY